MNFDIVNKAFIDSERILTRNVSAMQFVSQIVVAILTDGYKTLTCVQDRC